MEDKYAKFNTHKWVSTLPPSVKMLRQGPELQTTLNPLRIKLIRSKNGLVKDQVQHREPVPAGTGCLPLDPNFAEA